MIYTLPDSIEIGGTKYEIRTDFRVILDIIEMLSDRDLNDQEKAELMLSIFCFNPDWTEIPSDYIQEALDKCKWFIDCGEETPDTKSPQLVSWSQDFPRIAAPINRVVGYDIRGVKYNEETNTGGFHWWSFVSAYMEIGDCFFAQIVGIRQKKAKGMKMDKSDREFYRQNRHLIDIKTQYTTEEEQLLKEWT